MALPVDPPTWGPCCQQAVEPDLARIGGQPRVGRALAIVGEQRFETRPGLAIKAIGNGSEHRVIVADANRTDQPVEPV